MYTKVDLKLHQLLHIRFISNFTLLLFIYFFCSVLTYGPPQPKTNLNIIAKEDGTLEVTWQNPTVVYNKGDTLIEVQVDNYTLSYSYLKTDNKTCTINVATTETKVNIPNALLGVTYNFNLYCYNDTSVKCSNKTFLALPSCPNGWYQHQMQCYHISKLKQTWTVARKTCQSLLLNISSGQEVLPSTPEEEINQMVVEDLHSQGQVTFWTATEQCNQKPEDDISKYNCCISLSSGDNATSLSSPFTTRSNFKDCSKDQQLPVICSNDVKADVFKAENVTVSVLTNDWIHISWMEIPNQKGWKLAWRTVTIYNSSHQLLSTVKAQNANNGTILPPVVPAPIYHVLIWPHQNGYIMKDTIATSFALITPRTNKETNGGILQLPVRMEAFLRWKDGSIHVNWDVAIGKKEPNEEYEANGYQLTYGFPNTTKGEHITVNLTKSETSYDVMSVQDGQVYFFHLKCFFGYMVIKCAKIAQFNIELPSKMWSVGIDRYVAYEGSSTNDRKTWPDAEKECNKRGGHLLNLENAEEEKKVSNIFHDAVLFWFKANECANQTWLNESNPDPTKCCLQTKFLIEGNLSQSAPCSKTLPYICKYEISDLGIVKNLTAHRLSSTSVQLKWKTPNQLWKVSTYKYCACEQQNKSNCSSHDGTATMSPILITGLSRNTTYTITVSATIDSLEKPIISKTTITTGQEMAVTANISQNGKIFLDWSNDGPDEIDTSIRYVVKSETDQLLQFTVSNNEKFIEGLQYGKEYNFTLLVVDNDTGEILDSAPFNVTTRPNCFKDEFQYEMKCYFIGNQSTTWDNGHISCRNRNGTATQIVSSVETAFLRRISEDMDSPFWIDGQTSSATYSIEDDTVTTFRKRRQASELGCRIITSTGENEGVSVAQCGRTLPFMCQRKLKVDVGSVTNITLENISSKGLKLRWISPSWKPTGYNVTVSPTKAGPSSSSTTARSKRATGDNVIVGENSATVTDLEPATNYRVNVTPIVNPPGSSEQIKGKTTSFEVTTLDPNATNPPNMLPLTSYSDNQDTENNTVVDNGDELHTFRIISCVSLIILTLVALIIFAICRMYRYRDCMSQMCFEVSLILAHLLILLDVDTQDQLDCKTVAICIHFFFTSTFLFFALECFCHLKAMTKLIPLNIMNKTWQFFSVGWGVSVLIIIISASSVHDDYVKKTQRHCWLNLNGDAMLATVIPIGIFAGMAFIFLCLSICARPESNYEVDEESYIRYDPLQDIRWMQLFILVILVAHWTVGMEAAHNDDGSLFIAFIVLTIVLAITILMLRCVGDDEIRFRMKACCQGSPIGPGDEDIGKYLSKPYSKKGIASQQGPGGEGMLIVRKTYIFRP